MSALFPVLQSVFNSIFAPFSSLKIAEFAQELLLKKISVNMQINVGVNCSFSITISRLYKEKPDLCLEIYYQPMHTRTQTHEYKKQMNKPTNHTIIFIYPTLHKQFLFYLYYQYTQYVLVCAKWCLILVQM